MSRIHLQCLDADCSLGDRSQTRKKTKRKMKATAKKTTKATTATRSEHGKPTITFSKLVDKLEQHYGAPAPPPSTDPLELIIWENIAYLANDRRRAEAFAILKRTIGTRPDQILATQHSALAAVGKAGILPDVSAEKVLNIARIAYKEFDSDLRSALKKPLPEAKNALKRFPSIGDPGAEKILLFTRSYRVMALVHRPVSCL
jgi:hypothetical protein